MGAWTSPRHKIIDVFICKLRKKLAEASGGQHYIETVWGRGYVLRELERGWRADFRITLEIVSPAYAGARCLDELARTYVK